MALKTGATKAQFDATIGIHPPNRKGRRGVFYVEGEKAGAGGGLGGRLVQGERYLPRRLSICVSRLLVLELRDGVSIAILDV